MKDKLTKLLWLALSTGTAMVGMTIHGSLFWATVDFFFFPLCWLKWFFFHEVNLTIIKNTFTFFFN
jgi:hypothetical protein